VVCFLITDPVSFFATGRRQSYSPQQVQRGAPITRPGSYHYPDATNLVVHIEPSGGGHVVAYELLRNGRTLLTNDRGASDFHRWSFTLDDQDRLWFYSADIGLSLWTPVNGEWRETAVVDQIELVRQIPPESSLPVSTSAREHWNKLLAQP